MKVTILTLCLLVFLFTFPTQIFAVNFTVTRGDDRDLVCVSGEDCSLREAIAAANASAAGDAIDFTPDLTLITLTDEILIENRGTLFITGRGANNFTINGGAKLNRIFFINNAEVSISGLTLTGGRGHEGANAAGGFGGAIFAIGGELHLDRLNITENQTPLGGGGLHVVGGTCRLTNSTVSANASASCAGISSDNANLTVINSTVSGNRAFSGLGGGICAGGVVKIYQSTVTENSAGQRGGGIFQLDGGNTVLANSVVAKNIAGAGLSSDVYYEGTFVSIGGNYLNRVVGSFAGNGSLVSHPTDIRGTNPALGALAMNGGTTPTHAPLPGSPLIDTGLNNLAAEIFDQRGLVRIVDGNRDGSAIVDIGAFEVQPIVPLRRGSRMRVLL